MTPRLVTVRVTPCAFQPCFAGPPAQLQASDFPGLGDAASTSELRTEMKALRTELRAEMQSFRWQVIAAVALMLLIHRGAVWGILASHLP